MSNNQKYKQDVQKFKDGIAKKLTSQIKTSENKTVIENAKNDRQKCEVERKASNDACDFCKSQEGIYTQSNLIAGEEPAGHKGCKCSSIPHFKTTKNTKRPKMSKSEYALLTSEINTSFYRRFKGEDYATIWVGDYKYYFHILEFNEYEFLSKEKIK